MAAILVIDDDPDVRETLDEVLRRHGHKVLLASSAKDGLQMCAAHRPDLVITDIVMPEKDGLETIQALRAQCAVLPILAMSGAPAGWKVLEISKALGADEAVTKPFAVEEMVAKIERLLTAASFPQ